MKKTKRLHKIIAVFLTLNVLQTLIPHNLLLASNNGPNAPEAAAFEPVDATDMVSLLTGDFTYVLPLLNIPSPEGGYPLALSYHAGIAMDQEASWTGLGWNLNPGAINRSVNGFPDDYNNAELSEFFYDEGDSETFYSLSVGYGSPEGTFSVGLGFSWGGNRGLVGSVSLGAGIPGAGGDTVGGIGMSLSTNGAFSLNGGYTANSGLTLGGSIGTSGVGANAGFSNNGEGFNVGAHSSGALTLGIDKGFQHNNSLGLDFTMTSGGIGISATVKNRDNTSKVVGGLGTGINLTFANSINSGEYIVKQSGWTIPIMVPTGAGSFYASFGKQKVEWYLNQKEYNSIDGPVYFYGGTATTNIYKVNCYCENQYQQSYSCPTYIVGSQQQALELKAKLELENPYIYQCDIIPVETYEALMDIHEFPLETGNGLQKIELDINNVTFPSFDNYTVDAQGISGNIAPGLLENAALFGLKKTLKDKSIIYTINGEQQPHHNKLRFNNKPEFYFANEFSTYLEVLPTTFNSVNNTSILDYSNYTNDELALPRRKTSKFIEYFTNQEIVNDYATIQQKGFLKPGAADIDRTAYPEEGIGAFKVTGSNGKTYHYSLPVYNHEIITRTYGAIDNKPEADSYFEKRQMEPYATHWLLTAVTGPDYIDTNGNGYTDSGDYGYWVSLEYGMWSDAYAWKAPYGEEYITDEENPDIKTRYIGRKQLYYLDKVVTRTHTALFVKSLREDNASYNWNYKSVQWQGQQNSGDFISRFIIPSQYPLKLDKIILAKNEFASAVSKSSGYLLQNDGASVNINYPGSKNTTAYYNLEDNILDLTDNWQNAYNNATKVIDFYYKSPGASLATGTPHTSNPSYGRLTLDKVSFGGRQGIVMIPPYTFEYYHPNYAFDIEDKDNWGYHKTNPEIWSLHKIITPQGGSIEVAYQPHTAKPVAGKISFKKESGSGTYTITANGGSLYTIASGNNLEMQVGDTLVFEYQKSCPANIGQGTENIAYCNFTQTATVIQDLGNNSFQIDIGSNDCENFNICTGNITEKYQATYRVIRPIPGSGGIRVASITTTDGSNNYTTNYAYGETGNGVGYVSYLPFAPELDKEIPYSSELPAPKVMYDYVRVESIDNLGNSQGNTLYHFNVLKEKTEGAISYGDFFSIAVNEQSQYNATAEKEVNIREITVEDNLAAIGQVLDIQVFNKEGHLLSKTVNTYFKSDDRPDDQGIIQESFQTYKEVDYTDPGLNDKWLINSSTRKTYANALKSTAVTSGGFTSITNFESYDQITGQTLETTTYASDGTALKTNIIPAYTKYPEMGSKVDNSANRNMLSQEAASYIYRKDTDTGTWKLSAVGITTWKKEWSYRQDDGTDHTSTVPKEKIWRKHQNYTWQGSIDKDGSLQNFTDNFDWSPGATQPPEWKKLSETTRYNRYSTPLEVMDINDNKAATKMGRHNKKVFATANASYDAAFYSGAEDPILITKRFSGDVYRGDNTSITGTAHTGFYAVVADTNEKAFAAIPQQTGDYRVSVWVKADNYTHTRVITPSGTYPYNEGEMIRAGDWVQLNFTVPVITGQEVYVTSVTGTAYYDDFRLYPVASSMTSYVYNQWDELTHILGANNLTTRFEYDAIGRLIKTYAETADFSGTGSGGFKLVKEHQYRYKLVSEVDTDGDGIIDNDELYDPLEATLLPENGYNNPGWLTVMPYGGSAQYQYQYGTGLITAPGQIAGIGYTAVTSDNTFYVMNVPCSGGSYGYHARVVKVKVIDQETGNTKEFTKYYNKTCEEGGGGTPNNNQDPEP